MRPPFEAHVPTWTWALAALVLAPYACHELYFEDDNEFVPAQIASPECSVDVECTLMPAAITCCGECEPVPPLEAVPRTVLDALLLENEFACAPATRLCDPPPCAELPDGCEARAVCRAGRCVVIESGCGTRVGD